MYEEIILSKLKKIKTDVGDTVEGIWDVVNDLSESFANWSKDWTPSRAAKLDNLDASVSSVRADVTEKSENINSKINDLNIALNKLSLDMTTKITEMKITVDDIYSGETISDYVKDLTNKGTSAATYSNSTRMEKLISRTDCCLNSVISPHLLSYSIAKNLPIGTIFGNILGNGFNYDFKNIITTTDLVNNIQLFTDISNNANAFKLFLGNPQCRLSMFNKGEELYPALTTGSTTLSVLLEKSVPYNVYYGGEKSIPKFNMFAINATMTCIYDRYADVYVIASSENNQDSSSIPLGRITKSTPPITVNIGKFCNHVVWWGESRMTGTARVIRI